MAAGAGAGASGAAAAARIGTGGASGSAGAAMIFVGAESSALASELTKYLDPERRPKDTSLSPEIRLSDFDGAWARPTAATAAAVAMREDCTVRAAAAAATAAAGTHYRVELPTEGDAKLYVSMSTPCWKDLLA